MAKTEILSPEETDQLLKGTQIEPQEGTTQPLAEAISPFATKEGFQNLYDISKMFASSDMVPQSYQNKPMNCMIAVDMANRLGISPLMVMQNLWVVRGVPQWSGSACMSLIKGSGQYDNVKPVYTGEKGKDSWACHIEANDAKTGELVKGSEVSIEMAKKEGWYGKSGSKWQTMPEQMLAYRAAAFFARVFIPNALMGCRVEGEVEDMTRTEKYTAHDVYADKEDAKKNEPEQQELLFTGE